MSGLCIGILREVKNKWERRVPLTPDHVKVLVQKGITVLIQPSERRIFKDVEYKRSGAILTEDLSPAATIFGVKEFPESNLIANRSYMIFSHVIKAQKENMPFLDACLKKGIRLFDYECIRNHQGRMVAFGRYAGNAGMIDLFRGIGEKFLTMGYSTPFITVPSAYMHSSLGAAVNVLENVGKEIKRIGLPDRLSPMVFAFTGSGNVTKGALEIFRLLPHEMLSVADIIELKKKQDVNPKPHNKVYGVQVAVSDLVRPVHNEDEFSKEHYYACPEQYEPILHKTLLPFTNVIVNGIYWDHRFPRILTTEQSKTLPELYAIGDISCDINGSIQFVSRNTTISSPFFTFNPTDNSIEDGVGRKGITVLAVDNLPAELPREASEHFSKALVGFAEELSQHHASDSFPETLSEPLRQSCIVSNGRLRPDFEYISTLRGSIKRSTPSADGDHSATMTIDGHLFDTGLINKVLDVVELNGGAFSLGHLNVEVNLPRSKRKSHAVIDIVARSDTELNAITTKISDLVKSTKGAEGIANVISYRSQPESSSLPRQLQNTKRRQVLLLGSGFVAGPVVEMLSERPDLSLLIASDDKNQAELLAKKSKGNTDVIHLDGRDSDSLKKLIEQSSLVISLLPASLHVSIAKSCIASKTHLLTASYVSPEMAKLHTAAHEQGIIILNECGLDPGLDHMSAMHTIEEIKNRSGSVVSFESFCGGLPAPEAADNPFGYKFSWSPRGAILASLNDAVYKKDEKIIRIAGNDLLASSQQLSLTPALNLEHYPNRDSLVYASDYCLKETASTFYRGTIRYSGYCSLLNKFKQLGFFNTVDREDVHGFWVPFLRKHFNSNDIQSAIAEKFSHVEAEHVLHTMKWLGLLDESAQIKRSSRSVLDAFCALLENKLAFRSGERDMVILRHCFKAVFGTKQCTEEIFSTLALYGSNTGYSAMAQTVGIPVALAANLILDGVIESRGVLRPLTSEIYKPILAACAEKGIVFMEESRMIN